MQIIIENFFLILKIIDIFLNQKQKREEIRKKFNKLEKSLNFNKPHNNINTIHYEDLSSDKELNLDDGDDDEYRKIGSVRRLQSNRDYYKPKVFDTGFAGEVNNYIKYISERDTDEKLSPREYLNMTNRHKPIERLNNNNNNNNADTNNIYDNNNNNNNNTDRREWKIVLRMYIKCFSTKSFDETCTMHPKSKQVEFYMGSDTENVINTLFNTFLQNFHRI